MTTTVGVRCPSCNGEIVYNGNYYCERFDSGCDWALSHDDETGEPIGKRDKGIWKEIKRVWLYPNHPEYDEAK